MRQNDLVETDGGDARPLAFEADDVAAVGGIPERAEDAAARAGRDLPVPVEKANVVVQAELRDGGRTQSRIRVSTDACEARQVCSSRSSSVRRPAACWEPSWDTSISCGPTRSAVT